MGMVSFCFEERGLLSFPVSLQAALVSSPGELAEGAAVKLHDADEHHHETVMMMMAPPSPTVADV